VALTVPRETEELASSVLFNLGTRGIVTLAETDGLVELGAYFDSDAPVGDIVESVTQGLGVRPVVTDNLPDDIRISVSQIENQDWMQKWKEGFEPTPVGERFLIAPSWKIPELLAGKDWADGTGQPYQLAADSSVVEPLGNRILIQIDPGMAFGTGTHETTRLCLEAIERCWRGGKLLDVGTGTGILAIAAALLHPGSQVIGIDVDPEAVEVARENVAINRVPVPQIEVLEGQPKQFADRAFDLVVANLTAEVIIDLLPELTGCLAAGGLLILSGILSELVSSVVSELSESGFSVLEQKESAEWSALVARRDHR
jgi:ribosomal protein L11 methyltransferase